jgi:hypothetical protein
MSDIWDWNFLKERPSTLKFRNGSRIHKRTPEAARVALAGHAGSAHAGKVLKTCPACRELQAQTRRKP